jgi:hypothetical protein
VGYPNTTIKLLREKAFRLRRAPGRYQGGSLNTYSAMHLLPETNTYVVRMDIDI